MITETEGFDKALEIAHEPMLAVEHFCLPLDRGTSTAVKDKYWLNAYGEQPGESVEEHTVLRAFAAPAKRALTRFTDLL